MISCNEIVIERISVVRNCAGNLVSSALDASKMVNGGECGGVIAATFSNPDRFPALSVQVASKLNLPSNIPAFDLQLACSAYPYAIYLAGKLSCDLNKPILVIDGDAQTPLVDKDDHATGKIFSDAITASVVRSTPSSCADKLLVSKFDFLSSASDALTCSASGPIKMDGFKVFSFVATEVSTFLRQFGNDFDYFAPHQANAYMIRQLAKTLNLTDKLLTIPTEDLNPGSCSVAMAILSGAKADSRVLIAGFGAGYSASAGIVHIGKNFEGFEK